MDRRYKRHDYPRVWSPRPSLVAAERMLTDAPWLESESPSWLSSEFESSDCWARLESVAPLLLSSEFESVTCWPWLESVWPSPLWSEFESSAFTRWAFWCSLESL